MKKRTDNEVLRGGALHPGERRCIDCGRRIGDAELCTLQFRDEGERVSSFAHVNCPSLALYRSKDLARAWDFAHPALANARSWYRDMSALNGREYRLWLRDLRRLGEALAAAIQKEERIIAASLVIGLKKWSEHAPIQEPSPSTAVRERPDKK